MACKKRPQAARIQRLNQTEQGTGVNQTDSTRYRGDITETNDEGEVVPVTPIRQTPNHGTNEFTRVETLYKEGEQPEGGEHWQHEEHLDHHPGIDEDSREALGGVSPNIHCCSKIPAVKDRNINLGHGYGSMGHFPDITDVWGATIPNEGVLDPQPLPANPAKHEVNHVLINDDASDITPDLQEHFDLADFSDFIQNR